MCMVAFNQLLQLAHCKQLDLLLSRLRIEPRLCWPSLHNKQCDCGWVCKIDFLPQAALGSPSESLLSQLPCFAYTLHGLSSVPAPHYFVCNGKRRAATEDLGIVHIEQKDRMPLVYL